MKIKYMKKIVLAVLTCSLLISYVGLVYGSVQVSKTSIQIKHLYDVSNYNTVYRYILINNETIVVHGYKHLAKLEWKKVNNETVSYSALHSLLVYNSRTGTTDLGLDTVLNKTTLETLNTTGKESHIRFLANYTGDFYSEVLLIGDNLTREKTGNIMQDWIERDRYEIIAENVTDTKNPSFALYTVAEYIKNEGIALDSVTVEWIFYIPSFLLNRTTVGNQEFVWYILLTNVTSADKNYHNVENHWFIVSPDSEILLTGDKFTNSGFLNSLIVSLIDLDVTDNLIFISLGLVAILLLGISVILYRKKSVQRL